jgi:hypothetical protein
MNVQLFRLNSGEEILTRYEETETGYIFKDPAVLIPMEQGQIGMMPWMMYTDISKGVTVPKSFIVFHVSPVAALKNQYDANLNKGIVAPSKSSKLKLTMD